MKQNFAFISYNHRDVRWAKWLRRKLEWYRLPSEIHNEFEDSRYIRPVFRDRDELDTGILGNELRQRLENSKYLIVICSPNSAQSAWVSDEVQAFIDMGRLEYIIPFIIDGEPQSYADGKACERPLLGECFPKALRQWNTEHPQESLLGIAVNDDGEKNRQKAFVRVVSRMLGVSFDTLWRRHKREVRTIAVAICTSVAIALSLAYWFMVPVKFSVTIKDDPSHLPGMEHGVLTIDSKEYSVTHPDTTIEVGYLPGYYRLKDVTMMFEANRYYVKEYTKRKVTYKLAQHEVMRLHRDSTFAVFGGQVFSASLHPVTDARVTVGGKTTTTDAEGRFCLAFSILQQSETKHISIEKDGHVSIVRDDECPSANLQYLMY